jgi:hypothetical protein
VTAISTWIANSSPSLARRRESEGTRARPSASALAMLLAIDTAARLICAASRSARTAENAPCPCTSRLRARTPLQQPQLRRSRMVEDTGS